MTNGRSLKNNVIPDPKNECIRKNLVRNSAKCLKCDDHIVSRSVHDFVTCKCGNISVDGGNYYLRRVGGTEMELHDDAAERTWEDTSQYETHVINPVTGETTVFEPGVEVPQEFLDSIFGPFVLNLEDPQGRTVQLPVAPQE